MGRFGVIALALAALVGTARADEPEATSPLPAEPHVPPPRVAPPRARTPFDRNRVAFSAGVGEQATFGRRYFSIGAGVGYFVLPGVELELAGLYEFAATPNLGRVTPGLRYVLQPLVGTSPLVPYVGVFYSHAFVAKDPALADFDTVGARAGAMYLQGPLVFGLGVAYERVVSSCSGSCSAVYPDLSISFTP